MSRGVIYEMQIVNLNKINCFIRRKVRELQSDGSARARIVSTLYHWMTHPPMTGRPGDYVTPGVYYWRRTYATASHCRVSPRDIPPCLMTLRDRPGDCVMTEHPVRDRSRFNPFGRKLPSDGTSLIWWNSLWKRLKSAAIRNTRTPLWKYYSFEL